MVNESHMSLLRAELESLRARMLAQEAELHEVTALQRMADRMAADDQSGRFNQHLRFITSMLDGIAQTVTAQQRLEAAVGSLGLWQADEECDPEF